MRRLSQASVYTLNRQGSFGAFTLAGAEAQSIFYVSTVFGIDELEELATAKEVLSLSDNEVNFDTIIQRDIIPDHVLEIERYLSEGGEREDVRFFPPLLVALLGYHGGRLDPYYDEPLLNPDGDHSNEDNEEAVVRWGDVFQCRFGLPMPGEAVPTTSVVAPSAKEEINFNVVPYLTNLQVNPRAARLVVVDGQHRLRALKELGRVNSKWRQRVEKLTVPVCIVWPPWSYSDDTHTGPNVIEALRRIFVDVNHQGRKVSGHFKILLDDNDLAALAVRSICERMRLDGLLQFVEWNQHQDNLAYQLTSFDKITSVGLIYQGLCDSGVANVRSRRDNFIISRNFAFLLQLDRVREDLEENANDNTGYATLTNWDRPFSVGQRNTIRRQQDDFLAPAIARIFRDLKPYREMRDAIESSISRFDGRDDADYVAANNAIREQTAPEVASVRAAKNEILTEVKESIQSLDGYSPAIYRTQRFQQGVFAAFYYFVDLVRPYEPSRTPDDAAQHFVKYINSYIFPQGDRLFSIGAPWLENMVTQGTGAAIIKKKSTQLSVARLLLSRLGSPSVAKAVADGWTGEGADELAESLRSAGEDVTQMYIKEYRNQYWRSVLNSLDYDTSISDELREELSQLKRRAEGAEVTDLNIEIEEAAGQLEEKVYEIVDERTAPILRQFSAAVGHRPKQLYYIYPDVDEWLEDDSTDSDE